MLCWCFYRSVTTWLDTIHPYFLAVLNKPRNTLCLRSRGVDVPTNLSYTSADIDRYLADIVHSLSSAGFRHFRVCTAAGNAAVHRKALVLRSTPGAFPDQREDGEVGTALTRWATVPYSLWQRIGPRLSALKL